MHNVIYWLYIACFVMLCHSIILGLQSIAFIYLSTLPPLRQNMECYCWPTLCFIDSVTIKLCFAKLLVDCCWMWVIQSLWGCHLHPHFFVCSCRELWWCYYSSVWQHSERGINIIIIMIMIMIILILMLMLMLIVSSVLFHKQDTQNLFNKL